MIDAIHAFLVALPAFSAEPTPETPEQRAERLKPVAVAVWDASERRPNGFTRGQWSAVILALGWHESRYARYVQAGECHRGPVGARCDDGKARGPWQQHAAACRELWASEPGSEDAVKAGARCASRLLNSAMRRCRSRNQDPLAGAYSGYAGASCIAPWSYRRANTARGFMGRLGA